jgi:hypothetical protein
MPGGSTKWPISIPRRLAMVAMPDEDDSLQVP